MGFFTRLPLSDIQAIQISGETLTLSGSTNFVGTLKSKGVEIDATTTVTGDVLTYIGNGKIKLTSGAGSSSFNGSRTVTRSGIPNVNVGGITVNQFLEGYFFPAIPPGASLSGGAIRYFGNNTTVNLSYTATRNTLPINLITIDGNNVPLTNGGNTQSGVSGKTLSVNNTNQTFTLAVRDSSNTITNATTSVIFEHKRYFFGNSQNLLALADSGITTVVNLNDVGGSSEFSTTRVKATFTKTLAGEFFYYVIPASFGAPSFNINGLLNTDFSSKAFSFVNPLGYAASFVIWRTNNLLTGNFNFTVS